MKVTHYLPDLLGPWSINALPITISGIVDDSRHIKSGELFFALSPNYIDEAINRGARAIVSADPIKATTDIPIYHVSNLSEKIGEIASRYYDYPSKKLNVIGVTGTSGKTSCTQFIAQGLTQHGIKTGVIGSLGRGLFDQLQSATLNTPTSVSLQKLLADFYAQGITTVTMEVSSHGIDQGRINGTQFTTAAFTNISHDHLDYHGTLDAYAKIKKRLFNWPHLKNTIFNIDDSYGRQWFSELSGSSFNYAITLNPDATIDHTQAIISKKVIKQHFKTSIEVISPWGQGTFTTLLKGNFNLSNLLTCLAILNLCGIPWPESLKILSQLTSPPGRMQIVSNDHQPLVIVDYAHKPDALAKVLQTLREDCRAKLWCIIGCGGNRDRLKRPLMGQIAEQYADCVILTNDNPRFENPKIIIDEILAGMNHPKRAVVEFDRETAIARTIAQAKVNDIILIAGKGHETEQIIGEQRYLFDDVQIAKKFLKD